jgi:nucleotide-binding universal stress UspA family protein
MAGLIVASAAAAQTSSRGSPLVSASGKAAAPRGIRRLLLATDLSPASEAATARAISLAIANQASLVVISVVDPRRLRLPGGPFFRRVDQERAEVIAGAQHVVARARAAGAIATFLVWDGDPAESIIAAAESEAADVIVIGSHRRGRLGRLVLGSTSARVSEEASCEVVVVVSS